MLLSVKTDMSKIQKKFFCFVFSFPPALQYCSYVFAFDIPYFLIAQYLGNGVVTKFKKSVGRTIDTFGSNKKFHTFMKVLNYRFIKWTYLFVPMTHWVSVENFQAQNTAQKMKFSIKDFFSKCDQVRSFRRIWSHLPKKSLIENFIFCAMEFSMQCLIVSD